MAQTQKEIIRKGLKRLLRPAVAFAARYSFRVQALTEILKEVLLEVTDADLRSKGLEPNVSRLSAATGLHRRDVTRLWRDESPPKQGLDVISRIIGQWQSDKRYFGKNGLPKVLSLEGRKGTFAELVQSVSSDLNPYTVLTELERSQAVEKREDGIHLVKKTYQPRGDLDKGLTLLGNDSMTLVNSVSENIMSPEKLENLHVRTEYDNVPIGFEEEIRRWFLSQGSAFHGAVREFLSEKDRDINPKLPAGEDKLRVSFVTFSYTEPLIEDSLPEEPTEPAKRRAKLARPKKGPRKAVKSTRPAKS
jgi:hypothetical protein